MLKQNQPRVFLPRHLTLGMVILLAILLVVHYRDALTACTTT
jgi:hypothetical protein